MRPTAPTTLSIRPSFFFEPRPSDPPAAPPRFAFALDLAVGLPEAELAAFACFDLVDSDCLDEVRSVPPELVFFDPLLLPDAVEFAFADREVLALELFAAPPDDLDVELLFDPVRELAGFVFVFVAIRSIPPMSTSRTMPPGQ